MLVSLPLAYWESWQPKIGRSLRQRRESRSNDGIQNMCHLLLLPTNVQQPMPASATKANTMIMRVQLHSIHQLRRSLLTLFTTSGLLYLLAVLSCSCGGGESKTFSVDVNVRAGGTSLGQEKENAPLQSSTHPDPR
jgi:hypothetical protein